MLGLRSQSFSSVLQAGRVLCRVQCGLFRSAWTCLQMTNAWPFGNQVDEGNAVSVIEQSTLKQIIKPWSLLFRIKETFFFSNVFCSFQPPASQAGGFIQLRKPLGKSLCSTDDSTSRQNETTQRRKPQQPSQTRACGRWLTEGAFLWELTGTWVLHSLIKTCQPLQPNRWLRHKTQKQAVSWWAWLRPREGGA